jgi:alpha-L-fucosidase
METTKKVNIAIRKRIAGIFISLMLCLQLQAQVPGYLKGYEKLWEEKSPKEAALKWFKDARFGMFIHFSPASTLDDPRKDYRMLEPKLFEDNDQSEKLDKYSYNQYLIDKFDHKDQRVHELFKSFNPENFTAESIVDLAVAADMKYITFTTQHIVGGLFMFDTSVSKWNSKRTCGRDFVKELSDACQKRGLGLFFYVMPPTDITQERIKQMLKELLSNYGPVAGIWFDGIWSCYKRPEDYMESARLYSFVNEIQPQTLISFKTGYSGDEDFLAPEWHQLKFDEIGDPQLTRKVPDAENIRRVLRKSPNGLLWKNQSFSEVWENELKHKPIEFCTTIIKGNQWFNLDQGIRKTKEELLEEYKYAIKNKANYLLNIGPRGDGSVHPDDIKILQEFGILLKNQ